jgi:hypothetical protein
MRSGANSVQHLLTPAALGVLKHAVTEARRRGHPQVQPLHVVSMLLAHAGSRLRQACMLSHPQNAQSAECRALEVCFNVALDHLPQSAMATMAEAAPAALPQAQPILSNALMAALKRAHAHQRRGCPEHQQSPLLAVKVEIDQLIISILDDPSVSRVMKEAGFSSTNVKFNLEDGSSSVPVEHPYGADQVGSFYDAGCVTSEENETKSAVKFSPGVVVNPVMSAWPQAEVVSPEVAFRGRSCSRDEDMQKILDIFLRPRNAILISDTTVNANATVDDMALRIKNGSVPTQLQGLQFLDPKLSSSSFGYCSSLEMEQKLAELSKIVEECMPAGAILHIGDLQWLAEPMQLKKGPSNFCPAQRTAAELRQLLHRHANHRLWFVGVATSTTFARLQSLYPSLTSEWGLELVHVSTMFQPSQPPSLHRFASNVQSVSDQPSRTAGSPTVEESNDRFQCCATCLAKFEEERRQVHENENLSLHLAPVKWYDEVTSGGVKKNRSSALLQLQQRWQKTCSLLHGVSTPSPSPLSRLLSKPCGLGLDMSPRWSRPSTVVDKPPPQRVVSPEAAVSEPAGSPQDDSSSASAPEENEDPNGTMIHQDAPIQTNLALGLATKLRAPANPKPLAANPSPLAANPSPLSSKNGGKPMWMLQSSPLQQRLVSKNPWQSSSPLARRGVQQLRKSPSPDPPPLKEFTVVDDTLKGLYKALMQRVPWQGAAVAGISATVMKCRSGMGNIRGASAKTDTWLLLLGPDPVAKHAIAKALAETVFGGERSLLHLGFSESSPAKLLSADNGMRYSGRTPIDRLVEAIRIKKSAVILLEDIDQANSTTRSSIIRAMEISKLADSNGREVHMGNTIVVMTTSIGTETISESPKPQPGSLFFSEAKLAALKPGRAKIHASFKTTLHPKPLFTTKNISVTQNTISTHSTDTLHRDLPSWVPKRKPSNGELSLRPGKRTKSNFLNLDLNLATSECPEEECGDSEDAKLQKVLAEARYTLTDKFCALPDYAVGFAAYDFNGLVTEVLNKLGNSCSSNNIEIDLELLEHLIACVWKMPGGRPAFHMWLEEVFTKSIINAQHTNGGVMELSLSIDDTEHLSECLPVLPHTIVLSTE